MKKWTVKRIDDFGKVITGKTPSSEKPDEFGDVYPFITPSDIPETQRQIITERCLSEKGCESHRRIILPTKSVCVVCIGATIGKTCMTSRPSFSNQQINSIIPFKGKHDPNFIYYLATTLKNALINFAGGSATPIINKSVFSGLKILAPDYKEQQKIAAILSAYDDLIENNKRRIALLEKMAEEIYREWFVRMRFPGYETVKVVKGVPVGWEVKKFRDIVSDYIGGGWGEENQSGIFSEGAYVIRGTDIPELYAGDLHNEVFRFHKPSNLKSRLLKAGDFVFEVSGGSKNQLLGRNILVTDKLLDFFDKKVMAASFCKQIRFNTNLVSTYFMKYFLKLYYDCDLVGIYQVQSTGISNYQFESFLTNQSIVLPPSDVRVAFENIVKPMMETKDYLALANFKLKRTRDILLPRLISGKLSVENLDIQFPPSMQEEAAS